MIVTKNSFIQSAILSYDNPQCRTLDEFKNDVKKFSIVKKLLKSGNIDSDYVRLTLNNIVYLYNVFNSEICTKILFFKVRKEHWYKLKTYLTFLGHMPEEIEEYFLKNSDIPICNEIAKELRLI